MPASKLTLAKRVAELERQLEELKSAVAAQTAKPAEVAPKAMAAAAAAIAPSPAGKGAAPVAVAPAAAKTAPVAKKQAASDEISPEILAVITAAVTHFFGKSFRIRSARVAPTAGTSPWAQQGRVFIQASHNLAHR
jgi:hypothetical protein